MNKYELYMTDDNSVGLYSNITGDIFHSRTGALTEAIEKFINPSIKFFENSQNINVLDLCSGVGYNLKAFLLQNENISANIHSVDIDKEFILLSPFVNDSIDDIDLKLFILSEILSNGISISEIYTLISEVLYKSDNRFFCLDMLNLIKFLSLGGYDLYGQPQNNQFVHNIYYKYISNNMKNDLKCNKYENININYLIGDARTILKNTDLIYDIVFLDGFSPQKDPVLWTYDFLSLIKNKINSDSVLVSYSKSIPFRSALVELGFFVGKTFIDKIDMGTVASLNKNYILYPLDDYDLKLISTTSGITYKDSDLSLNGESILLNRDAEQKNSNRLSRTQFEKLYR